MKTPVPPVKTWSYSLLKKFEQCPFQVKLKRVDQLPPPKRDDKHPAERGNRVHEQAERYVNGQSDTPPKEAKHFHEDLAQLREMYTEGKVLVEDQWAFTKEFAFTTWDSEDKWLLLKQDALIMWDPQHATTIDYKTGRKDGNEISHMQQGQLYAISTFLKYPDLETVTVEFWYFDENKRTRKIYSRAKAMKMIPRWIERAGRLTSAFVFTPKPNKMNCKYCDYGVTKGTGDCPYAVGEL